jgi:hypothetical protein
LDNVGFLPANRGRKKAQNAQNDCLCFHVAI